MSPFVDGSDFWKICLCVDLEKDSQLGTLPLCLGICYGVTKGLLRVYDGIAKDLLRLTMGLLSGC